MGETFWKRDDFLTQKKEESVQTCQSESLSQKNKDLCPLFPEDNTETEILQHFTPKKLRSASLRDVYLELGLTQRALRVDGCGTFLEWHIQPETQKLVRANFCKDRLCSMCNWRRSLKVFSQVSQVMTILQQSANYEFLFLTLTVRNCDGSQLSSVLSEMQKSWVRMLHVKHIKKVVCGSFRAIEITRNPHTGEYHPHFHVILAVNRDYFHKSYLKQSEWAAIWRSCCRLEYNPVVDVRSIKNGSKGLSGAVAEAAKYSVKDSDFLSGTWEERSSAVLALLSGITQRKLVCWSGCFLDAVKQLNLDDSENGDLLNFDGTQLRSDVAFLVVRWHWAAGCYVRSCSEIRQGDK